jgi:hypothetical protein
MNLEKAKSMENSLKRQRPWPEEDLKHWLSLY